MGGWGGWSSRPHRTCWMALSPVCSSLPDLVWLPGSAARLPNCTPAFLFCWVGLECALSTCLSPCNHPATHILMQTPAEMFATACLLGDLFPPEWPAAGRKATQVWFGWGRGAGLQVGVAWRAVCSGGWGRAQLPGLQTTNLGSRTAREIGRKEGGRRTVACR